MSILDIFLLAIALSADAFAVSFSYGLVVKRKRLANGLKLALAVGLGQFVMPVAGWYFTIPFSPYIRRFDHWLAFLVFGILGLNIIRNALSENQEPLKKHLTLPVLMMLGVATSIDALVAGVSLYLAGSRIWSAAASIGMTTFVLALAGFNLRRLFRKYGLFKKFPRRRVETCAGLILILLGFKILYEHLFCGA